MKTYNMLEWMTLQPELGNVHLAASDHPSYNLIELRQPTILNPSRIYQIKGSKGFPYDIRVYDDVYIYDYVTELTWTDPKTYKRFLRPVPICKQIATPGDVLQTSAQNSLYEVHDNINNRVQSLGTIKYVLSDLVPIALGGDLPSGLALVLSYFWGGDSAFQNFSTQEDYFLQWPYGLVKWQSTPIRTSQNPTATSILNRIVTGAAPAPLLPPELQ